MKLNKRTLTLLFLFTTCFTFGQTPDQLLLQNYRPQSIYNIPVTNIEKAKFPVIDMHSHAYAKTAEEIAQWVKTMDKFGIEKTIILTGATGDEFDHYSKMYGKYPTRFDLWCGIDFEGADKNSWTKKTITELERCHKNGAKGVGEISDKGIGSFSAFGSTSEGLHLDDPKMGVIYEKLATLSMPINIHVAEPIWMYEPMDSTNDGLSNGYTWRINKEAKDVVLHEGLVKQFETAVQQHPNTTFIACHFLNCSYDLSIIGDMLDKYPNLYVDISARYAETASIPRFMRMFYIQHQNRLLYGTDMGFEESMYKITFRILETEDEHFYETERFRYHWALNGFDLPDGVLRKLYKENALKVLNGK